jgi:hypothetical protein
LSPLDVICTLALVIGLLAVVGIGGLLLHDAITAPRTFEDGTPQP